MFHSGMGIMRALIMGTIIAALIGFVSQDIRGFIFPMVFFLLTALHDFYYEQKELLKEKKDLEDENSRLKDYSNYYSSRKKKKKKRKKKKK